MIGALESSELVELSLDEAAQRVGKGWRLIAEIGWASKYVYLLKGAC